jgi:hypothetical protein
MPAGVRAEIRAVEVPDPEAAESLRFLCSPFFGCRTYSVEGKTTGVPPEEWLATALRRYPK